ncbi:MAG: insulinase family protein [Polyangiaceae bacterium]|nr:insulinase family protein [Polyangiaceae bacterium]
MNAHRSNRRFGARPSLAIAALCSALFGLPACGAAPSAPPRQGLVMRNIQFPLQDIRFPSGLRVIAERDDRMPLVAVALVVGAGSSSDPPGKEGLAHYTEHLAFRSKPFGKLTFRQLLERAGAGQGNAATSLDATTYYELVPAQNLPEVLRLEGARMLAPVARIEPDTLAAELSVVRSELRLRTETYASGDIFSTVQSLLFPPDHPYARPIGGTHESLSSLSAADVEAFLKSHYRPSNMTLALAGNIDLDKIQSLLEASLPPELLAASNSPKKHHLMPANAPEPPKPPPSPLVRKEGAVATPELWIAWSLPRAFDADEYLLHFLQSSLASAMAGVDREDDDLVDVTVGMQKGTEASILYCRAVLRSGSNPEASKEAVLSRVHHVWRPGSAQDNQIAQIAFEGRKRSVLIGKVLEAENIEARAAARAKSAHFSGDAGLYSRALQNIAKLDRDRLLAFATKYLPRERARAAVFFPPRTGAAPPNLSPITSADLLEKDFPPIGLSVDRLRAAAPTPNVSAYRQFTLANGLEVIIGKRDGLPITSAGLLFQGGVCDTDRPGTPAAAVAAMEMAFSKNKDHGNPSDFGARPSNSYTPAALRYDITGSSGNTAIMIAMLAERVRSLEIDSGAWERFKRDHIPYLYQRERKPEYVSNQAFNAALFGNHAYGCKVTAKAIDDVSLSDARAWLSASIVPERAVLAVVGEIDPDEVARVVSAELGDWEASGAKVSAPFPESVPIDPNATPAVILTHRPGATQHQLNFGCLLPPARKSSEDVRNDVLAEIVDGRLERALRETLGLTYEMRAAAWVLRGHTAALRVNGAVEAGQLEVSLRVLKETLSQLALAPVPANELAWAKLRVAQGNSDRYLANSSIVNSLLVTRNTGFSMDRIDRFAAELSEVEAEAIQKAAQMCMSGRAVVSIVGDEASAREALKQGFR